MPMAHNGIAKLIEECGELQQILGKALAYPNQDLHPDGMSIKNRIQNEIADVLAAMAYVADELDLDHGIIDKRTIQKLDLFEEFAKEK